MRRCAHPIYYSNSHTRIALCLHGFTGYPGEMAYPALRMKEQGWDVYVPRLSGHGTCGNDFKKTAIADLIRQIRDIWLDLSANYDEVAVLGHSMGGLLALNLAIEFPLDKLAVLAPAIGIPVKGGIFLRLLSLVLKRTKGKWKADPEYQFFDERDNDDDEYLGKEYWSWVWLKQLTQLMSLQKSTEQNLDRITTPVLGIFAENDTVVGKDGIDLFSSRLKVPFKTRVLSDCRHYIPYDPNPGSKEAAMDEVLNWFEG